MSIEEKIEEAANLHANKGVYVNTNDRQVGLRGYGESSFIAGANFALEEAFRWRDIKTEPPKEIGETYYILVTNDPNNEYDTGLFAFREVRYLVKTRKYWRPIYLEDL